MSAPLRFRQDSTFTIVQFTDTHWQNGEEADQRTRTLMEQVLDQERPDLTVITGDLIESLRCDDPAASLRAVLAPLEERGVSWAAVFGNHDSEKGTRADLARVMQACRFSLFQPGPSHLSGVGNYFLQILRPRADQPAATLWFFDSGSYAPFPFGRYEWIHRDQIAWYRRRSARVNAAAGRRCPLPALAFFHIPLPEYRRIGCSRKRIGSKYERVCAPWINTGLFRAMVKTGDVTGTFCGHDHVNDFEGDLRGIRLCYGRATGYNTYGRESFARGARVIRLHEGERRFETWLRLDDGTVEVRR
ncbi:MAG: metallophosphoesterase family protein [Bacillota bacterium]